MKDFKNKIRTCPHSGEEFYPKRHNQRFAHPSYRIAFHNNMNNEIRRARYFVDNKLHKNYSILLEIMKEKEQESFHKEFLIGKGFSFDVKTHYKLYEGIKRHALYNFIIIEDGNNIIIIRYKS